MLKQISLILPEGNNYYTLFFEEGRFLMEVLYEDTKAIYFYNKKGVSESHTLYVIGINKETGFLSSTGMVLEEILPSVPNIETNDSYIFGKCYDMF